MKALGILKFFFIAVPVAIVLLVIAETYYTIKSIKRLF
jgi:hypothetical protein